MVTRRALLLRLVLLPVVLPLALLLALPPVSRLLIPFLYRRGRPTRAAWLINRSWSWLASMGVGGRPSGRPRSNMVTWVEYGSQRYFVSMLGPRSDWIRNLEAAGAAAVFRQGRRRPVRLEEGPTEARAT